MRMLLVEGTTIVVAHRLSPIKKADLIMVYDKGRIAERGRHGELLSKKGMFHQLCSGQVLDCKVT